MDKSNAADRYVNAKAREFMYVMQTDVNLSYPLTGLTDLSVSGGLGFQNS
jgi:hypothetical protein